MNREPRSATVARIVQAVLLGWALVLIVGGLVRGLLLPVLGGIIIGISPLVHFIARRILDRDAAA